MIIRWRLATLWVVLCMALLGCGTQPVQGDLQRYTVKPGDTLYSIATRHGMSVAELSEMNRLGRDTLIYPGQVLSLKRASRATSKPATRDVPALPQPPVPAMQFMVPTAGRYLATTRPNGGLGLMFAGQIGQPIVAAAAGRVVYSGTGLLGYGQLLIIKHNDHYISAYGHLAQASVMEGTEVNAGQLIATMGQGTQGTPQLYFEIRIDGRPIDPAPLLIPNRLPK